jgi:hypothetical protein
MLDWFLPRRGIAAPVAIMEFSAMSAFQREILVRFGHCDVAGWVFYPRYFEMVSVIESKPIPLG